MKIAIRALLLLCISSSLLNARSDEKLITFEKYFIDKTLRIDYFHIGDAKTEIYAIDKIYQYGIWAGSRVHLLDEFNNGRNYAKIYDKKTDKLIFSKGFDTFFGEYKSGGDALNGVKRAFHESLLIPVPKDSISIVIEKRDKQNKLNPVFEFDINPADLGIIKKKITDNDVQVIKSHTSGNVHACVDVVILAEGYDSSENGKFKQDLQKFKDTLFTQEPYKSMASHFNLYGVFKPSEESGVDEPRAGIFKNTVLSATFNSLGSERYLMTEDNKAIRDLAAHVPYDAIYIMVNHKRYGGGGIYNLFCTFTSDNQWYKYLFLHEFGHSFSGLADEYYTSSVAYNDFYPKGIEPVESNITALLDPDKLKWQDIVKSETEIPTPWEKEDYDRMDLAWQARRREMNNRTAELKRTHAAIEKITEAEKEYALEDKAHAQKIDRYLNKSKFKNMVGAFEGAGYSAKGLYRPMLDCIMFSKGDKPFCDVCEKSIIEVINHYLE